MLKILVETVHITSTAKQLGFLPEQVHILRGFAIFTESARIIPDLSTPYKATIQKPTGAVA
jgi:hypothetical protein